MSQTNAPSAPEPGMPAPPPDGLLPPDAGNAARQHAHDVRNQLNSLELGLTLIGELIEGDPDIASTLGQMRQSLALVESSLQSLTRRFAKPCPVTVPAWELARQWQSRLSPLLPPEQAAAVEWIAPPPGITVFLDPSGVGVLLTELILTISRRSRGKPLRLSFNLGAVTGSTEDAEDADAAAPFPGVVLELREPPQDLPLSRTFLDELVRQAQRQGVTLEHSREEASGEWIYRWTFPSTESQD